MIQVSLDDEVAHVPLVIVHLKIYVPYPIPVIVVVGEEGVVIVGAGLDPGLETSDHAPVPTRGVFPAIVRVILFVPEEPQRVCFGPATATVGKPQIVISSSACEEQVAFEIVQVNL
jgi:hypothetical protein